MSEGPERSSLTTRKLVICALLIGLAWSASGMLIHRDEAISILQPTGTRIFPKREVPVVMMLRLGITGAALAAAAGVLTGRPLRRILAWALAGALGLSAVAGGLF